MTTQERIAAALQTDTSDATLGPIEKFMREWTAADIDQMDDESFDYTARFAEEYLLQEGEIN